MTANTHSLGRHHAAEPTYTTRNLHFYDGATALKVVDHEPLIKVLDQEDLLKQGIHTSQMFPGTKDVDELGSCTANTSIEALSVALGLSDFQQVISKLTNSPVGAEIYDNTAKLERAAIRFYHGCTMQTGKTNQEFPPSDPGSSGPYLTKYMKAQGWITGEQVASGAAHIVSLLQTGGAMLGTPWLNDWFEPEGPDYFIDGDGSAATLQSQINNGVAGGHEIYISAIEKLDLDNPANTVLRFRNHWDPTWADHGSARIHLSTLCGPLAAQMDIRRIVK